MDKGQADENGGAKTGDEDGRLQKGIETSKKTDDVFDNVVMVAGLPIVGADKVDKLSKALQIRVTKELTSRGVEFSTQFLVIEIMVNEETRETAGGAFLTFETNLEARNAAVNLNHVSFDRKHQLTACLLDDFDKIVTSPDAIAEDAPKVGFSRKGLRWWLQESGDGGLEQFCVRHKDLTEIMWHDPVGREPIMIDNGKANRAEGKDVWTKGKVCWSPQGSYFCTFHKLGVVLWGRQNFEKLSRFLHKDTRNILFSPNEDYIVTYEDRNKSIKAWRTMTQEFLHGFKTPASAPNGDGDWPFMIWSHDSHYLAGGVADEPGTICVYEIPDISKVLDLRFELPKPQGQQAASQLAAMTRGAPPLPREGAKKEESYVNLKFEWSPAANILAIFVPDKTDTPSRVILMEIPSKNELASKNLYNVQKASMHWQSRGMYFGLLTTLVRKTGKKGKKELTQIEIFRLKERHVPVDTIQIESLRVNAFHWETGGNRFAVLLKDEVTHSQTIDFYAVSHPGAAKRETHLVCSFESTPHINHFKWSPMGANFIAAAIGGGSDGQLIFGSLTDQNKVDVYNRDEHFQVNTIQWDSSGRYICTAVCVPLHQAPEHWRVGRDAGYQIWTFQGKLHHSFQGEQLYLFEWRPRPPTLLDSAKERDIHRRLKDYSRRYDQIDKQLKYDKTQEFLQARKKISDAFFDIVDDARRRIKEHEKYELWKTAYDTFEKSIDYEAQVTIHEEELEVKTEMV